MPLTIDFLPNLHNFSLLVHQSLFNLCNSCSRLSYPMWLNKSHHILGSDWMRPKIGKICILEAVTHKPLHTPEERIQLQTDRSLLCLQTFYRCIHFPYVSTLMCEITNLIWLTLFFCRRLCCHVEMEKSEKGTELRAFSTTEESENFSQLRSSETSVNQILPVNSYDNRVMPTWYIDAYKFCQSPRGGKHLNKERRRRPADILQHVE